MQPPFNQQTLGALWSRPLPRSTKVQSVPADIGRQDLAAHQRRARLIAQLHAQANRDGQRFVGSGWLRPVRCGRRLRATFRAARRRRRSVRPDSDDRWARSVRHRSRRLPGRGSFRPARPNDQATSIVSNNALGLHVDRHHAPGRMGALHDIRLGYRLLRWSLTALSPCALLFCCRSDLQFHHQAVWPWLNVAVLLQAC